MAGHNVFLTNWVRNAYSMELGLIPVLERQAQAVGEDKHLQRGIEQHLQATRRHAELMKGCLERLGDSAVGIQAAEPVTAPYARADGGGPHAALHIQLVDYVAESFEIASYSALATLALQAGDPETARVCEQILRDEIAMAHALDRRMPGSTARPEQETVKIARARFEALNRQDLDMFGDSEAGDFEADLPGASNPLNRERERAYLHAFLSAFPDIHFEIQRCIADGSEVALDWVVTGTHTMPLEVPEGQMVSPNSRHMRLSGSTTLDIHGGKIHRAWHYWDRTSLMAQLGAARQI